MFFYQTTSQKDEVVVIDGEKKTIRHTTLEWRRYNIVLLF